MPKTKLAAKYTQRGRQEGLCDLIRHKMVDCRIGTMKQLADFLGIDAPGLSMRMQGRRGWKYDELCRVFRLLKFTPAEIAQAMGWQGQAQ